MNFWLVWRNLSARVMYGGSSVYLSSRENDDRFGLELYDEVRRFEGDLKMNFELSLWSEMQNWTC